jgi:hypothetical protein
VRADLVRAPSLGSGLHKCVVPESLQDAQVCQRWLASLWIDDCPVVSVSVATQRKLDSVLLPRGVAVHQCVVDFGCSTLLKLCVEAAVRLCGAGKDENTAGLAVEAMYNPDAPECWFEQVRQVWAVIEPPRDDE